MLKSVNKFSAFEFVTKILNCSKFTLYNVHSFLKLRQRSILSRLVQTARSRFKMCVEVIRLAAANPVVPSYSSSVILDVGVSDLSAHTPGVCAWILSQVFGTFSLTSVPNGKVKRCTSHYNTRWFVITLPGKNNRLNLLPISSCKYLFCKLPLIAGRSAYSSFICMYTSA